jgi:hypothetical protein
LELHLVGNSRLLFVGAPDSPVPHQTVNSADFLPSLPKPTVAARVPLAHRTVRCGLVAVGSGHASLVDCALIALPIVSASAAGSPESLVNFSRSVPNFSRDQRVRRRASLVTGHCPVHPQAGASLAGHYQPSPIQSHFI